ncbi:MAG: NAD(P)H-dependent oxidoreductase subunit E [bacterium]
MKSELVKKDREKAAAALSASTVGYIEECLRKKSPNSYLISVLHKVQNEFGYLGMEHMDAVSVLMQIPSAKVTGVASFYHFFTFSPRGKHRVSLCMGTACFVKGAGKVLDKLQELLGIKVGETTDDGLFSIDVARCVGACALAPVMIVDEKVYAGVKPAQVAKILADYGYDAKKARK